MEGKYLRKINLRFTVSGGLAWGCLLSAPQSIIYQGCLARYDMFQLMTGKLPEHVFALGIVFRLLALGVEYGNGWGGCFALQKVLLLLEEA